MGKDRILVVVVVVAAACCCEAGTLPLAAKRNPVKPSFSFTISSNPAVRRIPKPGVRFNLEKTTTATTTLTNPGAETFPGSPQPQPVVAVHSAPVTPEHFPFAFRNAPVVTQNVYVEPQPVPEEENDVVVADSDVEVTHESAMHPFMSETPSTAAAAAAPAPAPVAPEPTVTAAAAVGAFDFAPPFVLHPLDQDGEYTFSAAFA
ncbi:hypothetical protein Pmani_014548 [Petrolisthes manimaculis]|uniref:Uncharacterized protein n=1 Tax=Petrolisthes manimaculis TaxID=1843537 RepID=A0AAE1PTB9_9EUCA|nr:hypothetical protein Pmani_014548 [Petrolisthes manimaculis]